MTDTITVPRALLEQAYEQGWLECAAWANRDDLPSDIDSPAYIRGREKRLAALAQPPEERYFCPRCGKRHGPPGHIHTCNPPEI